MEKLHILDYNVTLSGCGAVDSALGLGPRGRRFESFHPDQLVFSLKSTIKLYGGFNFSIVSQHNQN